MRVAKFGEKNIKEYTPSQWKFWENLEYFENVEKVGGKLWRREGYMRPKFSILGVFLALPTKTSFTTPHYYPKYEVWAIEIFLW